MKGIDLRKVEGFGPTLIARVRAEFPNGEWHDEPYLLTEVRGVGFRRADAVALKMGIRRDAPERINAAAWHVLGETEQAGNTCMPIQDFGSALAATLQIALPRSLDFDERRLCEEDGYISRKSTMMAEQVISEQMHRMMRRDLPLGYQIEETELRNDQRAALRILQRQNIFAMLGGPGTGKTWSVRKLAEAVERGGGTVELCAPTGKAAKRIEELSGREARTIHRLLRVLHPGNSDYHEAPVAHSHKFRFRHNRRHPLRAGLVIVDESSMLDARLAADLCEALAPETRLILIGDPFQLPSVGAGSVLRDLTVGEGSIPNVELTELKRQNPDLLIARNCQSIRFEKRVQIDNRSALDFYFLEHSAPAAAQAAIVEMVAERLPAKYSYAATEIQVLAPLREKGDLSCKALNIALRARLNPGAANYVQPWVGDRVVQRSNNYDLDIMNGDTGVVLKATPDSLVICFDTPERVVEAPRYDFDIDLAYALTIHKAQGSEWPAVVVVIDPSAPAQYLADAQLTYTAISRARDVCVCIGSRRALDAQAARHRAVNRHTRLGRMLR